MRETEIRALYWENVHAFRELKQVIQAAREHNVHRLTTTIPDMTRALLKSCSHIAQLDTTLQEYGLSGAPVQLTTTLQEIQKAQAREDYILLADYLELSLYPALIEAQNALRETGISFQDEAWLQKNMEILKERDMSLYRRLLTYQKRDYHPEDAYYSVELTTTGAYTLALGEEEQRRYLHSNADPYAEAEILADRMYHVEAERYLIIGWGLGYLPQAMYAMDGELDLVVWEPDIGLLYRSLCCSDLTDILGRARLVCDSDWSELNKLLDGRELILFRPELPYIKNDSLREKLATIANRQDSNRDVSRIFYQNVRENIRNCAHYVDELRPAFKGKRVVIVAGGPSLDKNIAVLKEKPEDVLILAVGTVYKVLISKGIPVDYVVVEDIRIYPQIQGLEDSQIPILILATADRRVSRCYRGAKYLICQQGYEPAASYAESRGYICYDSGGSVATLALDLAIRMEAASIAFVGLDLAYYENRAHAAGTLQETYPGYASRRVQATDGSWLATSQVFIQYKEWMERRIQEPDATMPVIDATEGGAKKAGFQVMTLQEWLGE